MGELFQNSIPELVGSMEVHRPLCQGLAVLLPLETDLVVRVRNQAGMLAMPREVPERRKRERIRLQCPAEMFGDAPGSTVRATTVNLSSQGLYCLSERAYRPGEHLESLVQVFTPRPNRAGGTVWLACWLTVIRVEKAGRFFGIGCQIEKFVLVREPALGGHVS